MASVRASASQSRSGAIVVLLGDMPGITSRMIDKIIEAGDASARAVARETMRDVRDALKI